MVLSMVITVVISAILIAFTLLLRKYVRNTNRRTRIATVFVAFVSIQALTLTTPKPSQLGGDRPSFGFDYPPTSNEHHHPELYARSRNAALIVFYNLFIPQGVDVNGVANAIHVVEEQMGQISTALSRLELLGSGRGREEEQQQQHHGNGGAVVYYNSIGNGDALPPERMDEMCRALHPRLDCVRLRHHDSASESVTLLSLYDFCARGDGDDDGGGHDGIDANRTRRVVYLHSKGSYHDHGKQTPWRRELTNSSLHLECLHPPDDGCDVCGAQYYTMFASMYPGMLFWIFIRS